MSDLEFLQQLDASVISKYLDLLNSTEKPMIAERLKRWRSGGVVEQPAALALYCTELRRLGKEAPQKKKPLPSEEEVEMAMVERARLDPVFFIEYVSGKAPARHHRIWLANIFHPDRKYINIIAPRGSAKTHIATYAMAYIIGNDPLLTNALISVSDTQASERIAMLLAIFQYNKRFQNVFPDIEIDSNRPNNTNEFSVRYKESIMSYADWRTMLQREGQPKDPTVKVAGMGGSGVIGSRWSGYLLVDDLVDGNMLTQDAQKKAHEYFMNTLMPCRTPNCRVGVIGTRWLVDDFAEKLQKNKKFTTIFIPAEKEINKVRISYWPEWWPIDRLEEEKELIGEKTYRTQYMCDPSATTTGLFTDEMVERDIPWPLPPLKDIYIATDWAIGVKQRNDFSCFIAVGIDMTDTIYLLDMEHLKQGPETSPESLGLFTDRVAAAYGHLAPIRDILIEAVAFSVTLKQLIENVRPDLPCTPVVPKGDKDHRATIVSKRSERGKLFINQSMKHVETLRYEWANFGTAAHDDTLDPIGLLLQHLGINTITSKYHSVKFANAL